MTLANKLPPEELLKIINTCKGDVWMCSKDGDRLNLKSILSQYLFISITLREDLLEHCWLECELRDDVELLNPHWNREG